MTIDDATIQRIIHEVSANTGAPEDFVKEDLETIQDWQQWLEEMVNEGGPQRAIDSLTDSVGRLWRDVSKEEHEKQIVETLAVIETYLSQNGLTSHLGGWSKPHCKVPKKGIDSSAGGDECRGKVKRFQLQSNV